MVYLYIKKYFAGGKCSIKKDLKGQLVLITGSNTGIGKDTARVLAEQGANIILACRDKDRTKDILEELKKKYNKQQIQFMRLDLSDLQSVREFANEFSKKYDKLDILVNNAGVMAIPERTQSKQGYEMQFATNHLGHFLLTNLLLKYLKNAQNSRVVVVSSKGHIKMGKNAVGHIHFDNINFEKDYDPMVAYAQSKLANVLFVKELQKRLNQENSKIKCVSVHPGVVRTELGRYYYNGANIIRRLTYYALYPIIYTVFKTSLQGAQTSLYCSLEEFEELQGGAYYADCQVAESSQESQNEQIAKQLWELSEKFVELKN